MHWNLFESIGHDCPQARIRYEMISNAELAIIIPYPTSVSGIIIVLLKTKKETLLDFADFTLQEQPEDNLMVTISWAWYNGSYNGIALYNDPVFNKSQ